MRSTFLMLIFLLSSLLLNAQQKEQVYDPAIKGSVQIEKAVEEASADNKHILVVVGGNWCPWCLRFSKFTSTDAEIDSLIRANYVKVNFNYSKENKNLDFLKEMGFPQRFGFPVILILDSEGERLHTQNTVFLEEDKGYNRKTVIEFLNNWKPVALDINSYKDYKKD